MGPSLVIELEVVGQPGFESRYGLVCFEVEVFIFNGTPEPLNEDIIEGAPVRDY
jgi:hypothetical protein